MKTWPLSDNSGYFFSGYDSGSIANICKYIFSSASCQWQSITNIKIGYGHLMISDTQFFMVGAGPSTPYDLHMYKLTFLNTSVDWADKIACASGTWTSSFSESVLSEDGLSIYSFINFGSSRYLYFVSLSVSTGSVVGTRYKSSVTTNYVWGSALNGDYLIASVESPTSLVMYSLSTSTFTIKWFSGTYLYGWGVEPSTGR